MVTKFESTHNCLKKFFYYPLNRSLDYVYCKNCGTFFTNYNYKKKLNKTVGLKKFHLNIKKKIKSKYFKNRIEIDKFLLSGVLKETKFKPKNLLDFGCGYGSMLFAAKELNIEPYAYDVNTYLLNFLQKKFKTIKKKNKLILKKNFFDCIVVNKVFNLSPNIEEDFFLLNKILKNKGYVILIEQVKDFSRYKTFLTEKNNNTHLLTLNSIKYFADKYNFKIIKLKNYLGDIKCILQKATGRNTRLYKDNENFSPHIYNFFEKNYFVFSLIYDFLFFIKSNIKKYLS